LGPHDLAARSVDALQRAAAEVKSCQRAWREVVELVRVNIHASGGHLVQKGLPQMGFVLIHKGHGGVSSAPEAIPALVASSKPSGAAADDNDAMGSVMKFRLAGNADMIFVQDYA